MRRAAILHYLTQWMWLSDSFVYGPIAVTRHRPTVVSRMPIINDHIYPPPSDLVSLGDDAPAEGDDTAALVVERLGSLRPDLVHVHHGYSLPDAASIARAFRVPLVVSFWGYDVTAMPSREPGRICPYLNEMDIAVVPSRFLAARILELGVDAERIQVLPGPVDGRFFELSPLPTEPRVAFVGRFVAKKGLDVLLAAWTLARRAVPTAELTLLGYGDPAPPADPGLGVRVRTPDSADPRRQVHDLIRWCRVYVSPSQTGPDGDSESQHIGNLEAQAAGRVVLTTDHGPIPEFVENGTTGVVVPQGDRVALADALIALLIDIPRCDRIGRNAAVAARRFHVERIGKAHDEMYSRLLGDHQPWTDRGGP
jgi:colanic acid/amylovoran biosynthesis glycosyltransferase